MSATGASPIYYDFDTFQEMTINTGGVDVTQQTGGVGINLVTKSGTDRFKGIGAHLQHQRSIRGRTTSPTRMRAQGAGVRQPDPEHQGLRLRGRRPDQARPRLGLGQLRQAERQGRRHQLLQADAEVPGDQGAAPLDAVHAVKDDQRLPQHRPDAARRRPTSRATSSCSRATSSALYNNFAKKERNARDAERHDADRDDAAPGRRCRATSASAGWNTGPNPTYKFGDQWVLSDRTAARRPVRARRQQLHARLPRSRRCATSSRRSIVARRDERPLGRAERQHPPGQQPRRRTRTTSCPARLGGDHAFKIGGYWRDALRRVDQPHRRQRHRALPDRRQQRLRSARCANPNDVDRLVRGRPHARRRHDLRS